MITTSVESITQPILLKWVPSGTCDCAYGGYGDVFADANHNWGIKRWDIWYPRGMNGKGKREYESYTTVDGFKGKITSQEQLRFALQDVGRLPKEADHEARRATLFPPKPKPPKKVIHRCCINGCKKAIKPQYSICYAHFDELPRELQQTIRRSYVPESKEPQSETYTVALAKAQKIIAFLVGDSS